MNIFDIIIGFLAGICASMGLGGGFVLAVYLAIFTEISQRTVSGINLLFFLPTAFVSLIFHLKNQLVDKDLVKKMLPGGLLGALLGTLGAQTLANSLLRKLFALFLLAFGLKEFFTGIKKMIDKKSLKT